MNKQAGMREASHFGVMPFLLYREKEDKMKEKQKQPASFQPDRILSYFKAEWKVLLAVTISGLIYKCRTACRTVVRRKNDRLSCGHFKRCRTVWRYADSCVKLCVSDRDRAEFEIYQAFLCPPFCQ